MNTLDTCSIQPKSQINQPAPISPTLPFQDALTIICQNHPTFAPKPLSIVFYTDLTINEPDKNDEKKDKLHRTPIKWSQEEQEFLLNGFRKFTNSWTQILQEYPMHPIRLRFDLKDKWKMLLKKSSDSQYKPFFDRIHTCVEQRNQNLTKGALFLSLKQMQIQKIWKMIHFIKKFFKKSINNKSYTYLKTKKHKIT